MFSWHITAKPEQIARALEICEMTVIDIEKDRSRGIELFDPVRSFYAAAPVIANLSLLTD